MPMIVVSFCYSIAWLCELLRFTRFHRRFRVSGFEFCFPILGLLYHTGFLYVLHNDMLHDADRSIGGAAIFLFTAAWGLVFIYLFWLRRYPNIPFGIIVLPIVLLLLGGGYWSASTVAPTGLSSPPVAKMLHLVSAAGFVIAFAVFIICRMLHFFEVRLLRKKRSLPLSIKLPSLEWSSTVGHISLVIAFCCLCFCVLGGLVNLLLYTLHG